MPEVALDITVDGKTWVRKVEVFSVKGTQMLCSYAERLFELAHIPAEFAVHTTEAEE